MAATGTVVAGADRYRPNLPGQVLALAGTAPAIVLMGWLVAAFGPAALGVFHPIVVLPVALTVIYFVCRYSLPAVRRLARPAPWWAVVATIAVAVAFATFTVATHNENVILRRDPGSYAQIGYWLAQRHGLTYRLPLAAFGSGADDVGFASPAFYSWNGTLIPQFMTGWPTLLAAAYWLAGWTGMLVLPGLMGGLAVLAVGGLTARVVGPGFAPAGTALAALAWPVLRVAQTTYSEPLAMVILAAGVGLLVDLVRHHSRDPDRRGPDHRGPGSRGPGSRDPDSRDAVRPRSRDITAVAVVTGLLLGGGELVRLDFGVDLALALPVLGWLLLRHRGSGRALLAGMAVGAGLGVLDCLLVTLPYVVANWASVRLMLAALALMSAGTVLAVRALRRLGRTPCELSWWRWVPPAGAAAVLLLGLALVLRPYLSTDHSTADPGVREFTEIVQRDLGLPVDGTRGYAEHSLWWVSWYLGWPLLAAALYGAAYRVWHVLRGGVAWLPVLTVYLGSTVLSLLRPGVTPDHPWADRRLVVEVVPAVVLLGLAGLAHGYRAARRWAAARPAGRALPALGLGLALVAVAVPALAADVPVALRRTELGELAASRQVCAALRPGDSVVMLDMVWAPTIRARCGLPVGQLRHPSPERLDRVVRGIRTAGRTPVVAGSLLPPLLALGLSPSLAVDLHTTQDQQQLVRRPDGTKPLQVQLWIVR